jgi:hypothetical protein
MAAMLVLIRTGEDASMNRISQINESNLMPSIEKGMSGREADDSSTDNRDPHRASCSG